MKQSGALISSRLIPPKLGSSKDTASTNLSVSSVSISKSMPSTSANFLNNTDFPSITGFDAAAPILPSSAILELLHQNQLWKESLYYSKNLQTLMA